MIRGFAPWLLCAIHSSSGDAEQFGGQGLKASILIVEDNADAREMLALFLRDKGYALACAEDGKQALDMIQSSKPDLIITDIRMPNLDGIELIKRLRDQSEMKSIPVIVMSSMPSGRIQDAMNAGADGSMMKPVQMDALLKLIKGFLGASVLLSLVAILLQF